MFDEKWPFEATTLTTDPNCRSSEVSSLSRECSKLALTEFYHVDEAEYSSKSIMLLLALNIYYLLALYTNCL